VLSLPQFGGRLDGERLVRARANPHYHDGRFVNPLPPAGYTLADAWTLLAGSSATRSAVRPARFRSWPSIRLR
jgi:hypothetical protein